ncbi:MAG: choice-of-anchor tandem repeat GloVer-containing protein [Methyloglobulus sp.]|nr:cadherin-like domain-containing protein [Methyloglobulus sp.]
MQSGKIDSAGVASAVYDFASPGNNYPGGKVIIANDGSLYGLNSGAIFKIAANGTYSEPFVFDSTQKGLTPDALLVDKEGSFYGTTQQGGEFGNGVVFKISPNGQETILYSFKQTEYFHSSLSFGPDGDLYGLFEKDLNTNTSYVRYKLTKESVYTELNTYSGALLIEPVMGADGSFYGAGQDNINHFIYKITSQGDLQRLYTFDDTISTSDIRIAIAKDDILYGASGTNEIGYFFKLDTSGVFTVLYSFNRPYTGATSPFNNVELGEDGSIYSGPYKLSPSGQLSKLPNFPPPKNSSATITLGNDGSLYGTVADGGIYGTGLVFKYNPISNIILPRAISDSATTAEANAVTVNVLANDKAFNGKTLDPGSVVIVVEPGNGTAAVNADGSVTYTPSSGFGGKDTFSYSVKDSAGGISNDGRVVVTVPKAVDDNYTVTANGSATQSQTLAWRKGVMANDLPSGLAGKSFALVGKPVRVSGEKDDGKLTITAFNPANGYLTFQLTGEGDTRAERQEAKVGVFEFSYTMTLNGVTTAPAKVTITVVEP